MSASSELAEFLEDAGTLGTVGVNIFVDKMPAGKRNAVLVAQYPGKRPEHRMDGTNDIRFEFPRVQIVVRNNLDATSFSNAELAVDALGKIANQFIEGIFYRSVQLINQPGIKERDENDLLLVVFDVEAERRRS